MKLFNKKREFEEVNQISAWIVKDDEDNFAWVAIFNGSAFPVSRIILSTVNIQVKASSGLRTPNELRSFLSIVPPGKYYTRLQIHHGMNFLSGVEIAFKDRHGKSWVRNGDGFLSKISQSPEEYYGLPLPISWENPKEKID